MKRFSLDSGLSTSIADLLDRAKRLYPRRHHSSRVLQLGRSCSTESCCYLRVPVSTLQRISRFIFASRTTSRDGNTFQIESYEPRTKSRKTKNEEQLQKGGNAKTWGCMQIETSHPSELTLPNCLASLTDSCLASPPRKLA